MRHSYKTKNTCSSEITFDLDGDIVRNVKFTGGCSGNLLAIQKLIDGYSVDDIVSKLSGTPCGSRPTSCADQLATAVQAAYKSAQCEA